MNKKGAVNNWQPRALKLLIVAFAVLCSRASIPIKVTAIFTHCKYIKCIQTKKAL